MALLAVIEVKLTIPFILTLDHPPAGSTEPEAAGEIEDEGAAGRAENPTVNIVTHITMLTFTQ